jgi:hypothetical protein
MQNESKDEMVYVPQSMINLNKAVLKLSLVVMQEFLSLNNKNSSNVIAKFKKIADISDEVYKNVSNGTVNLGENQNMNNHILEINSVINSLIIELQSYDYVIQNSTIICSAIDSAISYNDIMQVDKSSANIDSAKEICEQILSSIKLTNVKSAFIKILSDYDIKIAKQDEKNELEPKFNDELF